MTTTIAPALGHGAFTQLGTGSSPGYDAIDFRRPWSAGLQEGVYAAGSFEVTQRAAGANLSVDIAANVAENGIAALVQGDAVTGQGLYMVPPHTAVINETIGSNSSGNPRIDQVVLEVLDDVHDASGSNIARVRVVAGTASSGATLNNRTGAASLPDSCIRLADVLVANGASSITNSVIRDRRTWARGAYCQSTVTSVLGPNASTSLGVLSTSLTMRVECSGAPVRVTFHGGWYATLSGNGLLMDLFIDGVTANRVITDTPTSQSIVNRQPLDIIWHVTPSAGSHTFTPAWAAEAGSVTMYGDSTAPIMFTVEEIVRQNTANNATTTG